MAFATSALARGVCGLDFIFALSPLPTM